MKASTKNFDVQGMTAGRVFRQYLSGKLRPLWGFNHGLKFTHIVSLMTRHYLGYPMAYLSTRFEPQWRKVLLKWRRLQDSMKQRHRINR